MFEPSRSDDLLFSRPMTEIQPPQLAVFDLDGTLTWADTLLPFLLGFLRRHPTRLARLWRLPAALVAFALAGRDRGRLKARLIRMAMGGVSRQQIELYADEFVASLPARRAFRPAALGILAAHRRAGDRLVLLSASPDLYVPRIAALLGFDECICTEVVWHGDRLDGALKSANRRGEEKLRCLGELRAAHAGLSIAAYGNSGSDLPHLAQADRPLLVNANAAARRRAAVLGVPQGEWR
jgi:phosphatidylglycerophosphatase C